MERNRQITKKNPNRNTHTQTLIKYQKPASRHRRRDSIVASFAITPVCVCVCLCVCVP
ncbi:AGAP011779-PA [Anopheles gambiae str. PEST]|uniref:AGAP011779-PA n=1 Tax=Anopheles gambiae TaxID=7165 RepID=Q7PUZ0_ANOGA|nr:AGAP011779-PA [Anopheles gambiae str. PEST]